MVFEERSKVEVTNDLTEVEVLHFYIEISITSLSQWEWKFRYHATPTARVAADVEHYI